MRCRKVAEVVNRVLLLDVEALTGFLTIKDVVGVEWSLVIEEL